MYGANIKIHSLLMLKKVVRVATTELWSEISHILSKQDVQLQPFIFSKILVRTCMKILQFSNRKVCEVKTKTSQSLELGPSLHSDGHPVNWHSCGMHYHVTLAHGIPSHAAPARGDRESLENRRLIKNYEGLLSFLSQTNLLGDMGGLRMTSQIFPRTIQPHTNLLSAWAPEEKDKVKMGLWAEVLTPSKTSLCLLTEIESYNSLFSLPLAVLIFSYDWGSRELIRN